MQEQVNKRIFELIHSQNSSYKMAGIVIIATFRKLTASSRTDSLIDFQGEDNTAKVTRFANYLRIVLPGSNPQVSDLAAKALGHLSKPGGTLASEFVEFEVKRAMETRRNESKRYAAITVLKELALSSPTLLFSHVPQILDLIWTPLSDSKVIIREQGAQVLSICLQLMSKRESNLRRHWYTKIYEEANRQTLLTNQNRDSLHGCLLVYRQLFEHTGRFMESKYVPVLAVYNTNAFVQQYLSVCVDSLVRDLRRERVADENDRTSVAFMAIGKMSITVGLHILPYLDVIFRVIKEDFFKARLQSGAASAAFECLSRLCVAVKGKLATRIRSVLNLMFQTGLSLPLKQTLSDIMKEIPELSSLIKERFLNMLSVMLCGVLYHHPGAPSTQKHRIYSRSKDPKAVVLALECFACFDFSGFLLQETILSVARLYLSNENPVIRRSASITCCKVLASDPVLNQVARPSLWIVEEVLTRILVVAVTDSDAITRQTVLEVLSVEFDHHLARVENLDSLFFALNDEVFAVREAAVILIGRLSTKNPAHVMPLLRQLLISLLTELQYSNASLQKEECARLLFLLTKAKDPIAGVAVKSIAAIGELSSTDSKDYVLFFDDIIKTIMEALQDQSSLLKRQASLKSLGQVCSNTGVVISPYISYPTLLDILVGILKAEEDSRPADVHTEVEAVAQMNSSADEYFPTIVLENLTKMLRDSSLSTYHSAVIQAVMYMLETLGQTFVPYLSKIMPEFLAMMKSCSPGTLEFYFTKLADLVSIVGQHIRTYINTILDLIRDFWLPMPNVQYAILSLMESLAVVFGIEFKTYLATLLPLILQVFETDSSETKFVTQKAFHSFYVFGDALHDYLYLVIPAHLKLLDPHNVNIELKRNVIRSLGNCRDDLP
ncbi:ARM repeat-containing protein [Rhizoclosmatium globosum]|uniref:Serine/threonine-protein kinase TOR n=1 Tax=Rhizoclosmatium globosum TaxID=329046 RepID=A0A1Y2D176_9FUNG|nr:ARM repeat-containing protein [Rhizoclosmatium globosum]|eukprot:ORY53000.1 ARM repeat-containing protein [Rhizoclosmatium globosum]